MKNILRTLVLGVALVCTPVIVMVGTTSCAMRGVPYVVHPGAVNELDSRTYDALLFVKGMLAEADKKPPTTPAIVSMIARLRSAHAKANEDWLLYRAAFKAGQPTGTLETVMKSSTATMNAASASPELAPFRP